MKKKKMLLFSCVAMIWACSGREVKLVDFDMDGRNVDGAGDLSTVEEKTGDAADVATQDAAEVALEEAAPELNGPDLSELAEPEAVPEAVEEVVPPIDEPTLKLIESLCADGYCFDENGCEGINYSPGCIMYCIDKASSDEEFLKKLACTGTGQDEPGQWCEKWDDCIGNFVITDDCTELCAMVGVCDAFDNPMFGYSEYDCTLMCSGSTKGYPFPPDLKDCLKSALTDCDGFAFFSCIQGAMPNPCEPAFCSQELPPECSLVPDFFDTPEQCIGACQDWNQGQAFAASVCAEMGKNILEPTQTTCAQANSKCFEVPAELPEGAYDYCAAYIPKCAKEGDGLGAMGKLGYDVCAWQLTGLSLQMGDLFTSFVEATECAEALEICPSGDMVSMYCLLNVPPQGKELCAKVGELCEGLGEAQNLVYQCESSTAIIAAWMPGAEAMFHACINNAETCEDVIADCLNMGGDEEEPVEPEPAN